MFCEILKKTREKKGLTQNDVVTALHLAHADFANIDNVTISRWERGITKPTLIKKIRILRLLDADVMPLINSIDRSRINERYSFNKIRFNDFEETPKNLLYLTPDEILKGSCLHDGSYIFKKPIKTYLEHTHDRQFIDNFSFQNKKKIESILYYSDNYQILGHVLYFYINGVSDKCRYISSSEIISYNEVRDCSIFIFSMYSEKSSIYKSTLRHISTQLVRNNNIKYVYIFCKWEKAKKYLNHIGAEPFYYIDNKRLIFRLEAALWLSQAEVISVLQK